MHTRPRSAVDADVAASCRQTGMALLIIAVVPAFVGLLLVAFLPHELGVVGELAPFAWAVGLAALGVGVLRRSVVAAWAALVVCLGAGLALAVFALADGLSSRAGALLPTALLFAGVPHLYRLQRLLRGRGTGPEAVA